MVQPLPTERNGTVMTTMGTPLEQCNFFPQLSILSPFLVPLRSVGTGQGLYQSLSLGAERSGERWVHHLNNPSRIFCRSLPFPYRLMYQFLNCFDSVIFPSFLRFHPVICCSYRNCTAYIRHHTVDHVLVIKLMPINFPGWELQFYEVD